MTGAATPPAAATGPGTTTQHALDGLRRAIVARELRPGERIGQEDVAARLGVSIAPVREALRVLEQEGQVTYRPRRGYSVTELRVEDVEEIYALRRVLETRAAHAALEALDGDALDRIAAAARDCAEADASDDVAAELEANRRFHFAILDLSGQPHTLRLIRMLWDSTEAYRAIYYNSRAERARSLEAHERIRRALAARDPDALAAELDAHRERALEVLRGILAPPG